MASFSVAAPSTSNQFPITLTNVSRKYGKKWALKDVSLTIEPGVFGLLGRNGAGKTTLLNMLATLLEPTSGTITIGPYESRRQRWQIRSLLGFLPQEQGFYPQLTVRETLRYMAELQGLTRISTHVDEALEAVNLRDRARSRVGSLSGGMRRRLGLAVALLGKPPVIIVDEPTTGLDPVEQQRFRMLLGTLGAQGGQTILLSTHIVGDVATVAGRLAVLEKGQLLFQGSVSELAQLARGKCWLWRTTLEQVNALRQSGQLLVASLTPITDGSAAPNEVIARVEGPRPSPFAIPAEPTLEDGYFLLIGATTLYEEQHVSEG
uniref:Multidrug ABC transporter ATP-binding protein n=1 Tax=Thermosporothrix sp. COM3 TaxID=2490863 RepID=A0A455SJC3_9CHLR|nr:multidrug ABC transporter ATP-binding protein [Thermosporothrix sp. COM3]